METVMSKDYHQQDVNVILENLFDLGLEEVIQKIFLYLDPKSLKNCKSSCSQWREFIERRIWKSKSARLQLHYKLNSCWKNETPDRSVQCKSSSLLNNEFLLCRDINKELPDYVHYLVCDPQVIVCGFESGEIMAFQADTVEMLYVSWSKARTRLNIDKPILFRPSSVAKSFHSSVVSRWMSLEII